MRMALQLWNGYAKLLALQKKPGGWMTMAGLVMEKLPLVKILLCWHPLPRITKAQNTTGKTAKPLAKWYSVPYVINGTLVYVDDVENHFKTAKENGAGILSEIESGGLGKRYRVEDLEGQRWMFMQKTF